MRPRSWALIAVLVAVLLSLAYAGREREARRASTAQVPAGPVPRVCREYPDLPDSMRDPAAEPPEEPWLSVGGHGWTSDGPDGGDKGHFTADGTLHAGAHPLVVDEPFAPSGAELTVCAPHGGGVLFARGDLTPRVEHGPKVKGGERRIAAGGMLHFTVRMSLPSHEAEKLDSVPPLSNDVRDYPVIVLEVRVPGLKEPLRAASCDAACRDSGLEQA
ncbi:hypothetical protein [Streptomyces sp. N35]|uniref:hypothetical protein n=1 Tax=Streptomyces sp. N35 TaxID=2795730 RepID=UPI0018F3E8E5|nr:hypothetical protein [Streptomyces sp. N35]